MNPQNQVRGLSEITGQSPESLQRCCDRVAHHALLRAPFEQALLLCRKRFKRRRVAHIVSSELIPRTPAFDSKKLEQTENVYSVRVGLGYRALGVLQGSVVTWFWIGSRADYDRLV